MVQWSRSRGAALVTPQPRRTDMVQKALIVVLVGAALVSSACNTVRGAARDVNSVANCTENAINGQKAC
jgi:predicted small secreted protein